MATVIPKRLQEIRKMNDDKQEDLAGKLNVSVSTVRSWEQGKSALNHDLLVNICRLYGITSDYLLGLSDEYRPPQQNFTYRFTEEEQLSIQEYEAFLKWKNAKRRKGK